MRSLLVVAAVVTMLATTSCPEQPANPPPPAAPSVGGVRGAVGLQVRFDPPQRVSPIGVTYRRPDGTTGHAVVANSPWMVAFTYAGQRVSVRASQITDGRLWCRIVVNGREVAYDETTKHDLVSCDYKPVGRDLTSGGRR